MENANLPQVSLLESAIAELYTQVFQEGKITLRASYGLKAVLMSPSLSEAEEDLINRLLYAVRRGRLKVVDEF